MWARNSLEPRASCLLPWIESPSGTGYALSSGCRCFLMDLMQALKHRPGADRA